jgi:hypothetical protein
MACGRARRELTPESDGARLTTTFDYALSGSVFAKIADALIVKRVNATESRRSSSTTSQRSSNRSSVVR